jgi:hypothetical protein
MPYVYSAWPSWRVFVVSVTLLPLLVRCGRLERSLAGSRNLGERSRWLALRGGDAESKKKYKAIQVQIIHRHGDRTPITTMKDSDYWASQLISLELLDKIAEGTTIIRREVLSHKARGQGPFGKLTQLGLFQLIDVGTTLKNELCENGLASDELYDGAIFSPDRPLHPNRIRVMCTDFPRTIQSVQGLLVGLFPDGLPKPVEIDCRHTSWMIPDPQPRRSEEQEQLEIELAKRPHMLEREEEMRPLAIRCTDALRGILGDGAFSMAFGVGEHVDGNEAENQRVLPWAQLAEVTTCLKVRDLLSGYITKEDQEAISAHCAWRWFESLRNPRLGYLATHRFTHTILHSMRHADTEPPMIIYSGHDSTLIGLFCAFRLEQPSVWPEYGSYLKLELLEVSSADDANEEKDYVVRFYLNGNLLRSKWHGELREETPLHQLSHYISTEGSAKASS